MTRHYTETKYAVRHEKEPLLVITVYEEGMSRSEVRKENPYTKKHKTLVEFDGKYDFLNRRV